MNSFFKGRIPARRVFQSALSGVLPVALSFFLFAQVGLCGNIEKTPEKIGRIPTDIHLPPMPALPREGYSTQDYSGVSYRLDFSGNRRLSPRRLRRALKQPEFQDYSPHIVDDLTETLERFYRKHGFAEVVIQGSDLPDEEERLILLEIQEGVRYRVGSVALTGNLSFREREIVPFLRQYPRLFPRAYSLSHTREDRGRIRDFYRSKGYLDAMVTGDQMMNPEKGRVSIHHRIDEGNRYRLEQVSFAGNTVFSTAELHVVSQIPPNVPYAPTMPGAGRARLLDYYRAHGYAYSDVSVVGDIDRDRKTVSLAYTISEATQVTISRVHLAGMERTQPGIIWQEVDLRPGILYSRERLFENRKRIFGTGLFSSVTLEPSTELIGQATTDVTIRVEEGKHGRFRTGVGYGTDQGFHGSLDVGYTNLFGLAHEVGVRAVIMEIGHEAILYHRVRRVFGTQFNLKDRAYHSILMQPSFTVERTGFSIGVSRSLGKNWLSETEYIIEDVGLSDVKVSPTLAELRRSQGILSKIRAGLTWDTRDNASMPHTGHLNWFGIDLGGGPLAGNFDFIKGGIESAWFLPVTETTTLAVALRGGLMEPYGRSSRTPLSERFLTGGDTTLRGFPRNEVGPMDERGEFIGGNALALFNVEYRIPIWQGIEGAIFHDMGNVWSRIEDVDFSDTRETAGLGIRYHSPVGALRLDYGHILDRKKTDRDTGRFHISIGYAF